MNIPSIFWLVPAASVVALGFAYAFYRKMKRQSEGTERMREIAGHVRAGAMAYLRQQYKVVTVVFVVLALFFAYLAYVAGVQNPWGSLRFPHGRVLFGTGGFLRYEDRHLCLGADGTCGATVARPRAACGVPQRSRDGAGRRGAGAARYFALVYRPELLRRRLRRAETGHHHHHDADLRHGCLDAGALRPRGRRHLHQGGRCGGRSGR